MIYYIWWAIGTLHKCVALAPILVSCHIAPKLIFAILHPPGTKTAHFSFSSNVNNYSNACDSAIVTFQSLFLHDITILLWAFETLHKCVALLVILSTPLPAPKWKMADFSSGVNYYCYTELVCVMFIFHSLFIYAIINGEPLDLLSWNYLYMLPDWDFLHYFIFATNGWSMVDT